MSGIRLTEADEQVRRVIEKKIDDSRRVTIELQRRPNDIVPINRFPPEILAEIFCFCRYDLPSSSHFLLRYPAPLKWLVITRVCHHWRQVALQMPRLWGYICLDYPNFARRCVERARQAPLYLTMSAWSMRHKTLLTYLLSTKLHDVNSINLNVPQMISDDGLGKLPLTTSPLQSLEIDCKSDNLSDITAVFGSCKFPSIRSIRLSECVGGLPQSLLGSTLRELSLYAKYSSNRSFELGPFSHCLSKMSQLETLRIDGVKFLPSQDLIAGGRLARAVLPNLRKLVLRPPKNQYSHYAELLQSLEVTSQVQGNLKFSKALQPHDMHRFLLL